MFAYVGKVDGGSKKSVETGALTYEQLDVFGGAVESCVSGNEQAVQVAIGLPHLLVMHSWNFREVHA